jgi:hypothetical protein
LQDRRIPTDCPPILSTLMGRWAPKVDADSRAAILKAADDGMTYAAIHEAGKAGKLGVPPFQLSITRIGDYVRAERSKRRAALVMEQTDSGHDPDLDAIRGIVRKELEHLAGRRRLSYQESRILERLSRTILNMQAPPKRTRAKQADSGDGGGTSDLAQRLLSTGTQHNGDAAPHPPHPAPYTAPRIQSVTRS